MSIGGLEHVRHSVSFNLLKVVFSIYFVITFVLTGLHMVGEFLNARQGVLHEMAQLSNILKDALAESLWSLDEGQIQSQIKGVTQSKVVVGVHIIPAIGDQNWSYGKVTDLPIFNLVKEKDGSRKIGPELSQDIIDNAVLAHSFPIIYREADGHQTTLGLGIFYSSDSIVLDAVGASFAIILFNALLKTIALWTLVLWAGNRYITKPLKLLSDNMSNVNLDKLEQIQVIKRDGSSHELEVLEDSFNKMIHNLKSAKEEREKLSDDLNKSKWFLIDIINSMPSVLVVINENGIITTWNSQAERSTKISADQAIGQTIEAMLPETKGCMNLVPEAIASGQPLQQQLVFTGIRNQKKYINLVLFPLIRSEAGVVVRLDDVTAQMELEAKITKTEKMMSLGGLAAGMAHEINNPINTVMLGAQNIVRRIEVDRDKNIEVAQAVGVNLTDIKKYFDQRGITEIIGGMLVAGERASRIILNMLQFSRSGGAKKELLDVNTIIDGAVALLKMDLELYEQIKKHHISILRDVEKSVPPIMCSAPELEQVFLNVMKNAIQAVSESYTGAIPNVWIRIYKHKQRDLIVVEIEDNGPGMPESIRRHVFEPFYTTKAAGAGSSGLGLSVCYFIVVESHGGSIEAESTVGKGTKITIFLPLEGRK